MYIDRQQRQTDSQDTCQYRGENQDCFLLIYIYICTTISNIICNTEKDLETLNVLERIPSSLIKFH